MFDDPPRYHNIECSCPECVSRLSPQTAVERDFSDIEFRMALGQIPFKEPDPELMRAIESYREILDGLYDSVNVSRFLK